MSLFIENKVKLTAYLKEKVQNIPSNFDGFILKGDVSGIQDFIFTIKSRGAAKTLKSRSFFVQVMTWICLEKIKKELHLTDEKDIVEMDGGGTFFLFIPKDKFDEKKWEEEIVKKVQDELKYEEIYLVLAYERVEKKEDIVNAIEGINSKKLNLSRYRKNDLLETIFEPYSQDKILHFQQETIKDFTKKLSDAKSYKFIKEKPNTVKCFEEKQITLFEYTYELNAANGEKSFEGRAINKLPQWDNRLKLAFSDLIDKVLQERQEDEKDELQEDIKEGNIIDFDFIAKMAADRRGTEKLAILKLDIDNLGIAFKGKDLKEIKELSSCLNWFFDNFLLTLLEQPFCTQKNIELTYKDVIYNIYAGGDDCFLVGAWDAIFEFTQLLQKEFTDFACFLSKQEHLKLENKLTISAGIVVVHAKFPVIRFAELAEEALSEAKKQTDQNGKITKNAISVFGEVISWKEFEEAKKVKEILIKLSEILKESNSIRSLLERIKNSIIGYESLQEKIKNGKVSIQSVWRFNYYLRYIRSNNLKGEDKQKVTELTDKLVECYQKNLINAISGKEYAKAAIFPIAARWTEFLTRKN
ncbi:hypothetical protein [Bernardetia sp. MNP-M8]|uniref:type III-A CRISPR-associated protein Cas10/Csm1 n=1 Tax=Bernardetia sp. MNP-M8 TaxID=3127470 RepID=UPI0030D1CD40